jgi:methionyl aminopeptidase
VPGAKVVDACALGDKSIEDEAAKFYNKKGADGQKIDKGIAFPTCVSVNNQVCHNSPAPDDDAVIEEGQALKIDLGAHVDGYVAVVAHTHVVGADDGVPAGAQADVMEAAVVASEAAIRKLRPGASTSDVAKAIETVANDYGVKIVEGVLTHSMKRFVIDGNKVVLNKPTPELKADETTIELNEVYALDIVLSTGEGKPKMQDEKETNVYKRAIEKNYKLKMQASRAVFSEISKKFPTMPFTMRAMGDVRGAKLGLSECMKHELLHEYPVLYEKPGDAVAHVKCTVLVMQNGNDRVTTFAPQVTKSEKELMDEDLKALIAEPLKKKKKKKAKK